MPLPETKPGRPADSRIRGFDGLRAIAITLVFAGHATSPGRMLDLGAAGVRLFFVLRGFLIGGILTERRRRIESGQIGFGDAMAGFLIRRSLRIFPLYYVFIAGVAVAGLLGLEAWATPEHIAVFATYTTNLFTWRWGYGAPFSHLWSLAVEEQFYLVAAPLFLFVPAKRGPAVCIATLLVSAAVFLALRLSRAPDLQIYMDPFVNFGAIGLGALLSYRPRPEGKADSVRPAMAMVLVLLLPILLLLAARFGVSRSLTSMALESCASAWLILEVANNQGGRVVKTLDWFPVRWLGRISYGFYILHPLFIVTSFDGVMKSVGLPIHLPVPIPQILEYGATILAATISWHVLEKPAQGLARFVGRKASEVQPATP